jgi:hypothetical protein
MKNKIMGFIDSGEVYVDGKDFKVEIDVGGWIRKNQTLQSEESVSDRTPETLQVQSFRRSADGQ